MRKPSVCVWGLHPVVLNAQGWVPAILKGSYKVVRINLGLLHAISCTDSLVPAPPILI